jgi:hypothetical protein
MNMAAPFQIIPDTSAETAEIIGLKQLCCPCPLERADYQNVRGRRQPPQEGAHRQDHHEGQF